MQTIRIVALEAGEAALLASVCKFIPHKNKYRFQIVAYPNHWPLGEPDLPERISPDDLPEDNSPQIQMIFASLASYHQYLAKHSASSTTLFIYKNLMIMELGDKSPTPAALQKYGYRFSIVNDDKALEYLDEGLDVDQYQDITLFYNDKSSNKVLVTANKSLLLTLISIDHQAWTAIHPELEAYNLLLDIGSEPKLKLLREMHLILKQLDASLVPGANGQHLEAIKGICSSDRSSYSRFANSYDQYMAHVDYDLWISRILRWYHMHSSMPLGKILELACGTANVSSRLVAQGYHVDASDLSSNMLYVASQKPIRPHLYQASLTDPIPHTDYQLILCMFDSINYLLEPAELSVLFGNVYDALSPQGLFIFDISTRLNSEENFDEICSLTRSGDGIMVHHAWFEELQMLQKSSLRYFNKEIVGYSQQHELHIQKVYLSGDIASLISSSKLSLKAIYSLDSDRNLYPRHLQAADDKYTRLFFILKKE